MSIGLEWVLTAVIGIVGALVGVVWRMLNRRIDAVEEDAKEQAKDTQQKFMDVRCHIEKLNDDTVEIKEMRGALTAKIESIEHRIKELPSHRDFYAMLRELEGRIEARLVVLLGVKDI